MSSLNKDDNFDRLTVSFRREDDANGNDVTELVGMIESFLFIAGDEG